jgi:alpha-L-fucosidase
MRHFPITTIYQGARSSLAAMIYLLRSLIPLLLLSSSVISTAAENKITPNMKWWRDGRFGMFIHWGPSSLSGQEISWSRAGTGAEKYDQLASQFNPIKFHADEWVAIAKKAGMKYIVLTTKHHDGFMLWHSKTRDYHIGNTPFKRDIVAELAAASQKASIPFCVYYSPGDWSDPDCRHPENNPQYAARMHEQIKELLTNYGKIPLVWIDFDGFPNPAHPRESATLMRKLQPGIIITNRLEAMTPDESHGRIGPWGDYATPEQFVGGYADDAPWETCMTIANQWSWRPNDPIKSLDHCLRVLVGTVGGDGNLLFNVGPKPDGEIEPDQVTRLQEMGAWLQKNGESIYGTRGGPWHPTPHYAATRTKDAIYLHIFGKPGMPFSLPALAAEVKSATLLDGTPVAFGQSSLAFTVAPPPAKMDAIITVVKILIKEDPLTIAAIPPLSSTGSFAYRKPAKASSNIAERYMHTPAAAFDDNPRTYWTPGRDEAVAESLYGKTFAAITPDRPLWLKESWLAVDLLEPKTVSRMVIGDGWDPVQEWKVEYLHENTWKEAVKGTTMGQRLEVTLPQPVTAQKFRLSLKANGRTAIREWQMF